MFRPFHNLLTKIRDLLKVLDSEELSAVELALCSGDAAHVDGPIMSASTFTMSDFRQKSALRSRFVHLIFALILHLNLYFKSECI